MGLRFGLIHLFVFVTVIALLLQEYQVECRGGRGGGGRARYRGGGGSSGSGGGGGPWWMYVAIFGGIFALVAGIFIVIYIYKKCR